jgi:peptidyl-prolyl cis-trans isomerase D
MKTEPSPDDIAKNLDQTREQILDQRRGEAFQVFATNIINDYKKHGRVMFNAKTQSPQLPGM